MYKQYKHAKDTQQGKKKHSDTDTKITLQIKCWYALRLSWQDLLQ